MAIGRVTEPVRPTPALLTGQRESDDHIEHPGMSICNIPY